MATTVSVIEKPIPNKVSKDAYILGIQDNASGQQALYRLPLRDVRGNGANDLFIIPTLIEKYGTKDAFKAFAEANAEYDSLTNIAERFFKAAAKSVNGTYTSQFYKFSTSNSTIGEKQGSNATLVCTPSTNASAGTDEYADLPLFAPFDVNYIIDATTLEPVLLAIKGVYGSFDSAPADSLVGVMQMTGWVRRTMTEATKTVEYKAVETVGFKPLPEGVRFCDNKVRGFVIHAKYAAGYNSAGKLSSVSGVQPGTYRSDSTESLNASHDGQIPKWREWGNQYGGSSICDIAFYQLMFEIKYAVLGNSSVMAGCNYYYYSYKAAVSEQSATRILLNSVGTLVVGSCISLGITDDRGKTSTYEVCNIVKIASIEDVTINGTAYKAINLDTTTPFDTVADSTYIITQPWQTGSTNAVLGNDGSPTDNTSGKEPFKIQGIELMLGMYEVPADVTLYEDAVNGYTVYANRKAANITAGGSGTDPVTLGTIPKEETAAWKYNSELNWGANSQEAYMLAQEFLASSTTGYRAATYRDANSTIGWREWRAIGYLTAGGNGGLSCAHFSSGLDLASWAFGARASGSGTNRGAYTAA